VNSQSLFREQLTLQAGGRSFMNTSSQRNIKVGIIGATGYTGQELLGILFRHSKVDIVFVSSESNEGQSLSQNFPQFKSELKFINLSQSKSFNANDLDLVFFTTPNNIAVNNAKDFLDKGISVIDFSADFRLKTNEEYAKYYGFEHKDLDLLKSACYGLVEQKRKEIQKLKKPFLIANPGCYTTASNLALLPICSYKKDVFDFNSIIINGASGVSGAGKKLDQSLSFNEANENFKAYNIAGKHRHTPEINMVLSEAAKREIKVSFTPHLIPMFRGLLVTCYINTKENFDLKNFFKHYKDYYENDFFINIFELGLLPETKLTNKNNSCFIGMDHDKDCNRLIICSTIDNLVKGAAGQAVQSMNLAYGFHETLGLV
jgi:N-acetyl-gamma-glutamyl-phosphate reductase